MAMKALFLAVALVCAVSAAPESRIVGGTPTTIQEFPYIVSLVYTYPASGITIQRCVGSLISSFHVLTSGFCFTGAILDNMLIRAGSTNSLSGGSTTTLDRVVKHPDFVETPRYADIAVGFLSSPFGMSDTIGMLFLPPQNQYIADGQQVKIVSWGFESLGGPQLETLKTINLRKLPLETCQTAYSGSESVTIADAVICATDDSEKSTCMGDSGAPMVIDQVVVGLSSFFEECSTVTYPDVFTRIDRYTNWILSVATAPSSIAADTSYVGVKTVY